MSYRFVNLLEYLNGINTMSELDNFQFKAMYLHDECIRRGDISNAEILSDIINVGEQIISDAPKLHNVSEIIRDFATDARNYLSDNYVAA